MKVTPSASRALSSIIARTPSRVIERPRRMVLMSSVGRECDNTTMRCSTASSWRRSASVTDAESMLGDKGG